MQQEKERKGKEQAYLPYTVLKGFIQVIQGSRHVEVVDVVGGQRFCTSFIVG
jgi:hypothetical protein